MLMENILKVKEESIKKTNIPMRYGKIPGLLSERQDEKPFDAGIIFTHGEGTEP
jgi:hypothetical protein